MSTVSADHITIKSLPSLERFVDEGGPGLKKINDVFGTIKNTEGIFVGQSELYEGCDNEISVSCKVDEGEKLIGEETFGGIESNLDIYKRDAINFCANPPENLIFQGGGARAIAYIGAIKVLEQRGILHDVKRVAGTSAGAITATLIALGYSSEEIYKFLVEKPLTDFLDFAPSWGGICAGEEFLDWMNQVIKAKTGIPNCTFGELKQKIKNRENFKHLCVCAIKVGSGAQNVAIYFNSEDEQWDKLLIASALRASMSLPVIYPAYTLLFKNPKDQICYPDEVQRSFMDGGIAGRLFNLPIDVFDVKKFTQEVHSVQSAGSKETNTRTLAFSLCTPGENLPQEDRKVTCVLDAVSEWRKSKENPVAIHNQTHGEKDELRTVRISDTQVGTVVGFFEHKDKLEELIESGRAATLGFFQEHEEQLARMEVCGETTAKIKKTQQKPTAFYHTFKNNLSNQSIISIQIADNNISFHTNHLCTFAPLLNPIRDQFSFTKLATLDNRFSIFTHLRNSSWRVTESPEKRRNALKKAEDLHTQYASFYKKCFYWDIFRKLIIERNVPEYLDFFQRKGFSFTSPRLHPLWYAYHVGAFKNCVFLLNEYGRLSPEQKFDLKAKESTTEKTFLYYAAKEEQIDLVKSYCETYKKNHPESYLSLIDHRVNSTSGTKKSALDIAIEKRKYGNRESNTIDFLVEEGANYQKYYNSYRYVQDKGNKYGSYSGLPPLKMLIGDLKRDLTDFEKLRALRFCMEEIYSRECTHSGCEVDGSLPRYRNDHSEGYDYAEKLIRNKISRAPFAHLKMDQGEGLLMYVLKLTPNLRLARALLEGEFKDNVNQIDSRGMTPLLAIVSHGLGNSTFDYLLTIPGVDVNYRNLLGNTALHYAVSMKAYTYIKSLLSHPEINPNVRNHSGQTPLHLTQDRTIVELLINAGALDTIINAQGLTLRAMHYSLKKPEYLSHIAYTIGGGYMRLHESKENIGDKIVTGTFQTLFYTVALPFLTIADIFSSINHATSAEDSQCTCASCAWKRKKEEITLPHLTNPYG